MKYVKLIDNKLEYAPKSKGSIMNYNQNIELMKQEGYKPLVELESYAISRLHHIGYEETEETINEVVIYDETEEEYNVRMLQQRKEQFEKDFFNTSLGYISRAVHMQNGEVKDFLFDIKPNLKVGAPIITYTPNEDYTDLTQNRDVLVTEQFLSECEQQLIRDFYG